jgi:peptidoglycan/LPS O-acetylase OafA/YrhL
VKNRYSSIDLLRFLAAFAVAVSHFLMHTNGYNLNLEIISSISVEVFFIISGFVLAPQIISILQNKKFKNYKIFLIRRWYRTIPLYILSLLLTSIILNNLFTLDFFKYLFFLQNLFVVAVENDFFSIAWSLSVEEWFYIVFPLFLLLFYKKFNFIDRRYSAYFAYLFILLILLLRLFFSDSAEWGSNVRRVVIFRLDSIAFGFILYFLKDKLEYKIFNNLLLLVLIILTTILTFHILKVNALDQIFIYQFIFHYIVGIWGCLIVIFCYILDKNIENTRFIKINLYLGKISYSVYLFHLLLIYIISSLFNFNLFLTIIVFMLTQIILSILLYHYFEKPILDSRPNYK